jgi:outer membrane protein assembly factor BamB
MLGLATAACRSTPAPNDDDIKAQLATLGVEGKTFVHDLAETSTIHVHAVHEMDGDFLIEDVHGDLTYVDGDTLNVRWEFYGLDEPFAEAPSATPTAIIGISGDMVHVITRDAGVPSPAPRWVDVIPSSAPVATDSTMYVATYPTPSGNKTVYSIGLGSGYMGWGVRTEADVVANLAKGGPNGGDTFYFATTSGALFAYPTHLSSNRDPEIAWQSHAAAAVRLDLTVDGEDLGVVADDGRLICYDRITGNVRWEVSPDAGQRPQSSAQFSDTHAFYRRGGALYAFDRTNGAKKWSVEGGRRFVAQRGDRMLFTADGDMVVSVDTESGEVKGCAHLPHVWFPPQRKTDGTVTAITDTGLMVSVEFGW